MRKNLCVLILTIDINQINQNNQINNVNNILPIVCHTVGSQTMIETILELILKLSPEKIIVYVNKYNIECINKSLKHQSYSKLITFCVVDNELDKNSRRLSYSKCLSGHILVVPANCPLLKLSSLIKMSESKCNVKVNNNLFFIPKYSDSVNIVNEIDFLRPDSRNSFLQNNHFKVITISDIENLSIDNKSDYLKVKKLMNL